MKIDFPQNSFRNQELKFGTRRCPKSQNSFLLLAIIQDEKKIFQPLNHIQGTKK